VAVKQKFRRDREAGGSPIARSDCNQQPVCRPSLYGAEADDFSYFQRSWNGFLATLPHAYSGDECGNSEKAEKNRGETRFIVERVAHSFR
jgi:hypothetical protein